MNFNIKSILKAEINSNVLKTIAIIAMVIDHIGFYFSAILSPAVYVIFRGIGRISMPIFVYLLVQGFFNTKNFKKYMCRLSIFAIITQVLITITMLINIKLVPDYTVAKQVYTSGNILFSFVISLVALKILHEKIIIKKWDYNKNLSLKIILLVLMLMVCIFVPIDYSIEVFVISILMYYIEKFRIKIMLEKCGNNLTIKNIVLNNISSGKIKLIYISLIFLTLMALVVYFNASFMVLFSIIPIALYNFEKGKVKLKYAYYIFFPLHHILLYSLAMVATLT